VQAGGVVSTGDSLAIDRDDMEIRRLGEPRFASPVARLISGRATTVHYVHETDRVLLDDTVQMAAARPSNPADWPSLESGGPRERIWFDPATVRAGIVTCGGLCPGLNNVIRGLVLELAEHYCVREVLGFRDGYLGLVSGAGPLVLTPESVRDIHHAGGTVLGTSRGNQDADAMVDTLVGLGTNVLFVIGGDGTLRGAQSIVKAAFERGVELAVVGVPKTIDNDIPYIDHSFGFQTAFARAAESIRAAHTEAMSTPNGVGLVKLMGRHSGFIACYAALAHHNVDVVLIPEVPFALEGPDGLLVYLESIVKRRGHAVVVVAEGAGQQLAGTSGARDASGNLKLADIGQLLRDRISTHFAELRPALSLRYVDPGYAIRSVPANPYDAVYCIRLAQAAVHAAMAGRTSMVVGRWHGRFVHLPISLATGSRNAVDPAGDLWLSVLEVTGQPLTFG
jgi:6-phosphofructokinase 1